MRFLKKIIFYLISIVVFILLYFNLLYWNKMWLGILVFFLFFVLNGILWQKIFSALFGMKRRDFIAKLYSWLAVLLILSFVSSVWVVWYKISPVIVWLIFLISQIIGEIILFVAAKAVVDRHFILESNGYKYSLPKTITINKHILYIVSFVLLWLVGLFMLSRNTSSEVLFSPWQIINKYYIIVFFFITLILFLICLSKHKIKLVVFFLIMHSMLLHIYLPASHELPWGGDVWRHIAIENKLIQGDYYPPVLFGPEAKWREVAKIDLPEALIIPNKYFYGQLWGISVLVASVFRLDIILVNIWLMPILWGMMIPIIMFRIGRLLFGSWRSGLLLAILVSALFPFQALGGLTLPVSLGYLTFFFVFMLWLQYLRDGNIVQRNIVFLFSFLMLFGYTLHFILIWLIIVVSLLFQYLSKEHLREKNLFRNNFLRVPFISVGIGILVFFFPLFEYALHSTYFTKVFSVASKLTQIVGQFSGWYFASAIRPHDILSGNIVFNHTPDYAFVSSFFMDYRWPIILFMTVLYIFLFLGLFVRRKKDFVGLKVCQYIFLSVAAGYIISWFFMVGEHSLVRRLDAMVGFFLITFSLLGIFILFKKIKSINLQKIILLLLVIIFSWVSATTYASGPDMRVVSKSEYDIAVYLYDNIGDDAESVCIVADTWVLLVLEALSSQKIVGGGFPIDSQFGQIERVELYEGIQNMSVGDFGPKAREISKKDKCFIVLPQSKVNEDLEKYISEKFGSNGNSVGDFFVWQENINDSNP